jgi:hypothetical protein
MDDATVVINREVATEALECLLGTLVGGCVCELEDLR